MFSLALLLGGCPKRQSGPSLVYVPSPPPTATAAPASASGTLVIEEPSAPEPQQPPAEVAPQEAGPPRQAPRPRRRTPVPEVPAEAQPATEDQSAAPVPALQPQESPQQQSELRNSVITTEKTVQARITRLEQSGTANFDRKTLEGARMFLIQSQRALESDDLQRALNLARKAALLVDALERKP